MVNSSSSLVVWFLTMVISNGNLVVRFLTMVMSGGSLVVKFLAMVISYLHFFLQHYLPQDRGGELSCSDSGGDPPNALLAGALSQ